jgi:hypothetical protein
MIEKSKLSSNFKIEESNLSMVKIRDKFFHKKKAKMTISLFFFFYKNWKMKISEKFMRLFFSPLGYYITKRSLRYKRTKSREQNVVVKSWRRW